MESYKNGQMVLPTGYYFRGYDRSLIETIYQEGSTGSRKLATAVFRCMVGGWSTRATRRPVFASRSMEFRCSTDGFKSFRPSKKRRHPFGCLLFLLGRKDLNNLNATRTSVAGDGLTEPNLHFCPFGQKCKQVRLAKYI